MIENLKTALPTMMLTVWSTVAMAQTTPGTPDAAAPTGASEGTNWIWIIVAVVVVAALLYYFLGRGRSTRV